MALITMAITADLDGSGAFATDLTPDVHRDNGIDLPTLGRERDLDAAGMGVMTLVLDNSDGKYTPKNTGSSLYANFPMQFKHVKCVATFNSVNYSLFYGVVTSLQVDPSIDSQTCTLSISDLMYVLSRREVRLPYMREAWTGNIVDRLLDLAEEGELVTNTRFETATTGYAAAGGGTISRVTDRDGNHNVGMLHDPAALKTTTGGASGDGYTYVLTSVAAAGASITGAAYVWAEDSTAIGMVVAIKVRDNTGIKATTNVTLTDRPQRVVATGTFDGASTSRWVEVTSTTTDVYSFRTGALHVTLAVAAIARSTDKGKVQLPHVSYHRYVNALQAIQEIRHEEMGALFYFNGAGTAIFEQRDHRWMNTDHLSQAASSPFDEEGQLQYIESADDRVKQVILDYPQWVTGTAGTQVWALDRVPLTIPASATITIEADFGGALVRDVIVPVVNTDYTINATPEGDGADESGNVTVTFQDYGGGASITLANGVARRVYLTELVIRGTPVRIAADASPIRYTPTGGPSLASELSVSYRHNASEPHARAWAQYLGNRYVTQRERLTFSLSEPFPNALTTGRMPDILGLDVSDTISIQNTDLDFSTKLAAAHYYIDSIDRTWGKDRIDCTYRVSRADHADVTYFRWGVSKWGGTHVRAP